jgi:hypothetical protein
MTISAIFAVAMISCVILGFVAVALVIVTVIEGLFPELFDKQSAPIKRPRRSPAESIAERMAAPERMQTPQTQASEAEAAARAAICILCRNPLSQQPTYLVGVTKRRAIWSWKKKNARRFTHDETILRAWVGHLERKHGEDSVFVVWAEKARPVDVHHLG